ncbi:MULTISPECIES: hypothetical protein [Campylobacter]|uniref:hypothetical protein n=1 Tax=Campylobacter TaxID=194 RepID=UPI001D15D310|nr:MULTISPECIES: hypothetical protein [unclassified Campylobacter]
MNKIYLKFLFLSIFCIVFFGCATLNPQRSDALQVTIISPMLKINDTGFLHAYKNSLNLQIYSIGVNSANIKINSQICVNRACYDKLEFNRKFFLQEHYENFLSDILQKKHIYNSKGVIQTSCGFDQNISNNSIKYEVCDNYVKFIDTQNKVKIIIKELK